MQQPAPIDSESAQELLKEATKMVSVEELESIGLELERKVAIFQGILAADQLGALDERGLREVTGLIFTVRSKRKRLLAGRTILQHREAIASLLHGAGEIGGRFSQFTATYAYMGPHRARALASELLHYSDPKRHWLWTTWIWDPSGQKGSLSLVSAEGTNFNGGDDGDVYRRIGRATAWLQMDGRVEGYTRLGRGLLGADVFLALVAAFSMLTIYKHRISQEFLRFLPEFTELTRRLLGVKHLAEVA